MPKYVEERELIPVPGAFGVTLELRQWIKANRVDGPFYDGTGPYRNCLRIYIEEEYGFREWMWTYPGTVDELVQDWVEGRRPLSPRQQRRRYWENDDRLPGAAEFRGEFDQITWRPDYCKKKPDPVFNDLLDSYDRRGAFRNHRRRRSDYPFLIETGCPVLCIHGVDGFHGTAHVHEDDDSVLNISYYKVEGLDNPKVEVVPHRVLEELASI